MIAMLAISTAAWADICALKNGTYDISGTPCTTADGDGDDNIDLVFNIGSDLTIDIVYEQTAGPYDVWLYHYLLIYDDMNMNGAAITCDPNLSYFDTLLGNNWGLHECTMPQGGEDGEAEDNNGNYVIAHAANNFNTPSSFPDPPVNFVLDQIRIPNSYSTPSPDLIPGSEKYTFTFSMAYTNPTDVILQEGSNHCNVFSGDGECDLMGINLQTILQSRLFIQQPPCYVGPPGVASVTSCNYSGAGTCADGEPAQANLSIGMPTMCCADSWCSTSSTDCGTYGVDIEKTGVGTLASNYTSTSYSDTTPVIGDSLSYTITGVDTSGACLPSSNLSSGGTVVTTHGCYCGDPPTITITDPTISEIGDSCGSGCETFLQGTDISIKYSITDADGTLPDSISNIYFFYTNDLSVSPVVDYVYDLNSSGVATAKISKSYVSSEANLYFGITIVDEDGFTSEYPDGFTCSHTSPGTSCFDTVYNKIDRDNIIVGTECSFIDGEEPYPNMFPFMATGYSEGSEGNLLKIYFALNEVSDVTLDIYTHDDVFVRTLQNSTTQVQLPGEGEACSGESCNFCNWQTGCQWDGAYYGEPSVLVSTGTYKFVINAACTGDNFYGQTVTDTSYFHVYSDGPPERSPFYTDGLQSMTYNDETGELALSGAECTFKNKTPILGHAENEKTVEYRYYLSEESKEYSYEDPPDITSYYNTTSVYGLQSGTYYGVMKCYVRPPEELQEIYTDVYPESYGILDQNQVEGSATISGTVTSPIEISTTLPAGWNIVSFPVDVATGFLDVHLSDDADEIFSFGMSSSGMDDGSTIAIEEGKAYWIYVDNETTIDVTGVPVASSTTVEVQSLLHKWNLIGNPYYFNIEWGDNISIDCGSGYKVLSEAVSTNNYTSGKIYEFNGSNYAKVEQGDDIVPWKGYFIYLNNFSCAIKFSSGS